VGNKSRLWTKARARHLAKLNTKGFYPEIGGGEVDRDVKVTGWSIRYYLYVCG
jgi:hypothetical protein